MLKGVILAGGTGSRLHPLTKVTNKHLLHIYNKPMVFYPLEALIACGIKDILIVSGENHAGHFVNLLGSGRDLGINLSYEVQEGAGGIADALRLADDFAGGGDIAVILGDNIFGDYKELAKGVQEFKKQEGGVKIFLKKVSDAHRFGIASIEGDRVVEIEEKPQKPKSNLAVTGLYIYDNKVFDIIDDLKPSARGEYEITDVNNWYIKNSKITYQTLATHWTDAGTFDSLLRANVIAAKLDNTPNVLKELQARLNKQVRTKKEDEE